MSNKPTTFTGTFGQFKIILDDYQMVIGSKYYFNQFEFFLDKSEHKNYPNYMELKLKRNCIIKNGKRDCPNYELQGIIIY